MLYPFSLAWVGRSPSLYRSTAAPATPPPALVPSAQMQFLWQPPTLGSRCSGGGGGARRAFPRAGWAAPEARADPPARFCPPGHCGEAAAAAALKRARRVRPFCGGGGGLRRGSATVPPPRWPSHPRARREGRARAAPSSLRRAQGVVPLSPPPRRQQWYAPAPSAEGMR